MVDRKPERRQILDPMVADLLDGMERKQAETRLPRQEREKKIREREKIASRRESRATYDLPPRLRLRVRDLADQERVPASQIVTLALYRLLQAIERQEVDLGAYKQPSRSPRYDWNLSFPEDWGGRPAKPPRKTG